MTVSGAHESKSLVGKVDPEKSFLLSKESSGEGGPISFKYEMSQEEDLEVRKYFPMEEKKIKFKFPGYQPKANFFFFIYQ